MNLIFDGAEKTLSELLDEVIKQGKDTGYYNDENCCEVCGSARAVDVDRCESCNTWIALFVTLLKAMPEEVKQYLFVEHKETWEEDI